MSKRKIGARREGGKEGDKQKGGEEKEGGMGSHRPKGWWLLNVAF